MGLAIDDTIVEKCEGFLRFHSADDDLVAFYVGVIEGVEGLAPFKEDVVGDVDDVVDGAGADGEEEIL